MGTKLGCVVVDTDRPDVEGVAIAIAQQACLAVGATLADLYVATEVSVAPLFAEAPDREVAVFVLRAQPRGPGADALAQGIADELGLGAMTAFVNDFYQSGGFQIWGPVRSGLLVDFGIDLAGTSISYLDAPRLGVARLLGIDPEPAERRRLTFLEQLCFGEGHDLRIVEDGLPLSPARRREDGEEDHEAATDSGWRSTEMAWPMMDGAARRELRRRREEKR